MKNKIFAILAVLTITAVPLLVKAASKQAIHNVHIAKTEKLKGTPLTRLSFEANEQLTKDIQDKNKLEVPFKIKGGGYLEIGIVKHALVYGEYGQWCRLFLRQNGYKIPLDSLNKLKGHFEINTANEALALAQLKTSPKTCFLWFSDKNAKTDKNNPTIYWPEVEVVSYDEVTPDFCFGDKTACKSLRKFWNPGLYGIVLNKEKLESFGIEPKKVIKKKGYFEIHRTLLAGFDENTCLNRVVEQIGFDGSYTRKKSQITKVKNPELWYTTLVF